MERFQKVALSIISSILLTVFAASVVVVIVEPAREWFSSLQTLSTILLTFLTFVYVLLTYFILDSNNRTLKEQTRPYIIASFLNKGFTVYFSVKNIGSRPAHDISISVEPSLVEIIANNKSEGYFLPMLNQSFLPPSGELKNSLNSTIDIIEKQKAEIEFKFDIKYFDSNRKLYEESYSIRLDDQIFRNKIVDRDSEYYISQISKDIEELRKSFDQFLGDFNQE